MSISKIKIDNEVVEFTDLKDLNRKTKDFDITIGNHIDFGNNVSISKGVKIGVGCVIGDNVVIKENVSIADECIIQKDSTIGEKCVIETGVRIGQNVTVNANLIVGEEAIIDDGVFLEDTFYIKTAKSNVTYCGNGKASIGCQLFKVDFWIKHYQKVADKFNYTKEEIEECLSHMKHIKNNIE